MSIGSRFVISAVVIRFSLMLSIPRTNAGIRTGDDTYRERRK